MDREEAFVQLLDASPTVRLEAARVLEEISLPDDESAIRSALAREDVGWIEAALGKALRRSMAASTGGSNSGKRIWRGDAVAETTYRLVHEITPVIGLLRLHASREVPDYENSRVAEQLSRLQELLGAIESLGRVSGRPATSEFSLSELAGEVSDSIGENSSVRIRKAGPDACATVSDRGMVGIVLRNAILNAVEASATVGPEPPVVTVSWGDTDLDWWISVIDSGVGLPIGRDGIGQIGASTKSGHFGLGLAVVHQAADSLDGTVDVSDRAEGGVRFVFRWPKDLST